MSTTEAQQPPAAVAVAPTASVVLKPTERKAMPPTAKVSKALKRAVATVVALVSIAGGIGLGLVVQKNYMRVHAQTVDRARFVLSTSPERPLSTDVQGVVANAKTSVLVSARILTSRQLINSLCERAQAGVKVTVLLCENSSGTSAVAQYLRSNGVSEVHLDRTDSFSQFIVVDGETVVHSSTPWTAQKSQMVGDVFFLRDRGAAASFTAFFEKRVLESSR